MTNESDDLLRTLPVDQVIQKVGVARAIGLKHVASLLFTYRCTIACAHCLFNCSPRQKDVQVSFSDGIEFMRQLRSTDRVIHIAGGEVMMAYPAMLALCRGAREEGASPHFFETNASWCVDEQTTRERYETLQSLGLQGVLISADPFHQAFVPPGRRERAFRWAVEIFGRENVAAGDLSLKDLEGLRRIGKTPSLLREHVRQHPPRLVGRAGNVLSQFIPDRPLESLVEDGLWHGSPPERSCRAEFDSEEMWEIHIDPYGNIQTCCGIIVGNAHDRPLVEQMKHGFPNHHPLIRTVCENGPFGLLQMARERGYHARPGYPQKCGLCWEVRKFLRPFYPEIFGPSEIYEEPRS